MITILYRAFDAEHRLLYVGISSNPAQRLGQHTNSGPWDWVHHTVEITLEPYSDRKSAAAAERCAIRDEDPVWNIAGRPIQRRIQWWVAYLDRHADDIGPEDIEEQQRVFDTRITAVLRATRVAEMQRAEEQRERLAEHQRKAKRHTTAAQYCAPDTDRHKPKKKTGSPAKLPVQ